MFREMVLFKVIMNRAPTQFLHTYHCNSGSQTKNRAVLKTLVTKCDEKKFLLYSGYF